MPATFYIASLPFQDTQQIGGYLKSILEKPRWNAGFASYTCRWR